MPYVLADPDSRLNWSFDWSDALAEGDTIITYEWSIVPVHGASPQSPTLSDAATDTVIVDGMRAGRVYYLTNRVTTAAGIIDDRTIVIRCDPT